MKSFLSYFLLVAFPLVALSQENSCEVVDCAPGFQCNFFATGDEELCVAISCEAEGACEEGFTCVPEVQFCITTIPCPQFVCVEEETPPVPDCEIECEPFEICVPAFCPDEVDSECVPFICENNCAVVDCAPGFDCNFFATGDEDICVAVSCEAEGACEEGFICVPEELFCITSPCPQFNCIEEEDPEGCFTDCGNSIPDWTVFVNDGESYCKRCLCLFNDITFCLPFSDCSPNPELEACSSDSCKTSCGNEVAIGVTFQDEGPNSCNTCTCEGPDQLSCTEIGCIDTESCETLPTLSCTTDCGRLVEDGESFTDDGTNNCNQCTCSRGNKVCTKIFCETPERCT